jgi:CubicO group peptidase (beta-lactamase class C family)
MDLSPALVERIDALFADMDQPRHPGAALLVIDRGKRLYSKCYGLADLETQRLITTDTSFYLASIAKQFTAMAIMMLAEQGKLHFDDRLPNFFPRFPSWGAEITLRQMLHHTSGMPQFAQFIEPDSMIGMTNEDVLERLMNVADPEFPPGAKFAYNGVAYSLLATIAESVSGRSFAEFLKDGIFDPLGMKHSVVYDSSRPTLHEPVRGYLKENGRFVRWDYPLLPVGEGGLFSTLDDLLLWDQALNGERLVSRAALEQAFTSGTTNDGTSTGYGFGWYTAHFPGRRHVAHGGTLGPYVNYIIRFLDIERTIIVLTNLGPIEPVYRPPGLRGPGPRAREVAEILFTG